MHTVRKKVKRMLQDNSITVLLGHAGVGKTNVALHLAMQMAAAGHPTTLADLDTVNVYFRASDYGELLADAGVRVEAPVFARTTLDTPSLSGRLDALIGQATQHPVARLVIDVGGDDDGATTIGRYGSQLREAGAAVLYVVSAMRALTPTPQDAAAMLPDIEEHARLRATGVLNSTNLGMETNLDVVRRGRAFSAECARILDLPLVATAVPEAATNTLEDGQTLEDALDAAGTVHEEFIVMPKYVGVPWE